ncbi:hypothetical protein AGMMS50249_4410 [candidate division SR1 bacterium]|nr:hypothetical protein AGMMS50249_4410 [candidate division SR1 bacterium]
MTKELLAQFLPAYIVDFATKFSISEDFLRTHPDLVTLVLESKSIAEEKEKQSWFDLYPLMNDEQISKLRDILTKEKEKLAEIEAKYQEKQTEIKKKYDKIFSSPEYQQQQANIKAAEQTSKQQETVEADALLDQI